MTNTAWTVLIIGVAILVASAVVCIDAYRNAIDLDNLTDDGPDDLDRWLAQTPVAPVDDWSAWEREVAT